MSCKRRGVPVPTAPVFRMLVLTPKLDVDEILAAGLAKFGWLNRLNASRPRVAVQARQAARRGHAVAAVAGLVEHPTGGRRLGALDLTGGDLLVDVGGEERQ